MRSFSLLSCSSFFVLYMALLVRILWDVSFLFDGGLLLVRSDSGRENSWLTSFDTELVDGMQTFSSLLKLTFGCQFCFQGLWRGKGEIDYGSDPPS